MNTKLAELGIMIGIIDIFILMWYYNIDLTALFRYFKKKKDD